MKKKFLVVYEKGKKNYGGFAPDVPGCFSLGDTLAEIRANLLEALQLYIDTAMDLGHRLPVPTSKSVTLPLEGDNDPNTGYVVEHLTVNIPRSRTSKAKSGAATPRAAKRRAVAAA
jgi:predicted RNase H-like HicB family nuclease